MKRPAYDSPSLPITWDRVQYVEGQNEYISIRPEMKKLIDNYFKQAEELAAQGDTTVLSLVHSIFGENPYELKEIINRWMLGKNDQLKELLKKSGQGIELPDPDGQYRDESGCGSRAPFRHEDTGSLG